MKRRDFIKYFGAGLAGPAFRNIFNYKKSAVEHLVPYVVPPAGVVPGLPTYYNSVCRQCAAGCGIEVKLREGRAKKLEGNAEFPVNFGKLCSRGQAGLQVVYNPDRLTTPLIKKKGEFEPASWSQALKVVADRLRNIQEDGKIVYLAEPLRGTLAGLFKAFAESLGGGEVVSYDPLNDDGLLAAEVGPYLLVDIDGDDNRHSNGHRQLGYLDPSYFEEACTRKRPYDGQKGQQGAAKKSGNARQKLSRILHLRNSP